MATLRAAFAVDMKKFDLNFYKENFESGEIVYNSKDPTNGSSPDRYTIWTTNTDYAIAFHGEDFAYEGYKYAHSGTVEGFSEWFWNYDDSEGLEFGITRTYVLKGFSVPMEDFFDALKTGKTKDDYAILKSIMAGNDDIKLSDEDDRAYGYGGNDVMRGMKGNDTLIGNDGEDKLRGGKNSDTLKAGDDDDIVRGNAGNDDVRGQAGNDEVNGGGGDDKVNGGVGNDSIRGKNGRDLLWGGDGDDTFVFQTGDEVDIIRDWEANDTIDLSGLAEIEDYIDLTTNHMSDDGTNTVIDGLNGDVLTINNTLMASLSESDFIFAA